MKLMNAAPIEPADLLDLRLLPAWVKEPGAPNRYEHYTAEEQTSERRSHDREGRRKHRRFSSRKSRPDSEHATSKPDRRHRGEVRKISGARRRHSDRTRDGRRLDRHAEARPKLPEMSIRFLPRQSVFENVVSQLKSGSVAYSLFALARLFLEKPGRYEVRLTAKPETPLYQLGEGGAISVDREFLDRNAFRFAQRDFYQVDVVESDPIKGNFSNVERC